MKAQNKTKGTLESLRLLFLKQKVFTIKKIEKILTCSERTARRRLKELNALNCYNKNGLYYTLPEIVTYDSFGLWFYRGIAFSKHGNLTETVVALANSSDAGLSATELITILKLKSSSFLSFLRDHQKLRREKRSGRRYIYYSANDEVYHRQDACRQRREEAQIMPSDAEAVAIFIEVLKYKVSDMEQLCRRLSGVITSSKIKNLFHFHGLDLKKKSPSKL